MLNGTGQEPQDGFVDCAKALVHKAEVSGSTLTVMLLRSTVQQGRWISGRWSHRYLFMRNDFMEIEYGYSGLSPLQLQKCFRIKPFLFLHSPLLATQPHS